MARAPGAESVVIRRLSGTPGRHGVEAPRSDLPLAGVAIIPRTSTESDDPSSNTVVVGLTMIAPGGTVLLPTDEVVWQDKVYEIEGEPGDYRKRGRSRIVIVALTRVRG